MYPMASFSVHVVRSVAFLSLLAPLASPAQAEGEAPAPEPLPRIPAVETAAEDLAVLREARRAQPAPALQPIDPGASAGEDRKLPPPRPGTRPEPTHDSPEAQRVFNQFAAKTPVEDTAGGDDLLVLTSPSIRGWDLEITEDGDIYLAVAHVPAGSPVRIDIFLSEDGGDTWDVWGSRASGFYHYDWPSLHVAEGPNARLFLAYVFYEPDNPDYDDGVIVGSSELDAVDWELTLGFWVPTSSFRSPDITTDHRNWNAYRVYLTAREYDAEESSDIWFGVSGDYGSSFQTYEIGTLSGDSVHYWSPAVEVGWGGYVHVVWYLYINNSQLPLSHAIRYRRAPNRALGGAASWDPALAITSASDPADHQYPKVAAQSTDQRVVINYTRLPGSGFESVVRASANSGLDWPDTFEWTVPELPYLSEVGADPGRFYFSGRRYDESSYGFTTVAATSPGRPVATEILADDTYSTIISTGGSKGHPDPSHGGRFALVWKDESTLAGGDDHLYFDAEWRGDPGFPNHHDAFPLPLAAKPTTPPAIVDVDGDGLQNEIVFADQVGFVHAIEGSGTKLPGFPVSTGASIADESLAVGDLNGDGRQETVVGTTNGWVHAFAFDGSTLPGWPVDLGTMAPAYVSIGTVSRLAKRDVIVTCGNEIHLLRFNGTEHEYASFPIAVPEPLAAAAAIGDLEADGNMEIVVVAGSTVRVYTHLAESALTLTLPGTNLHNTPSIGDLDFDGTLEIVVPTDLGDVWVFDHDGGTYPGWPYNIGEVDDIQEVALADFAVSFQLVVDLAFAQRGSRVHARSADGLGLTGWPKDTSPGWFLLGSPVVAGLNGAANAEITIGDRGNLVHGWQGWIFGMAGWPKDLGAKINLSPAVGDVDQDGLNEVVYLTDDELVVLDVNGTPVEPVRSWPMYGHDPQRTSCLECPVDLITAAGPLNGSSALSFAAPTPNPSSGRTVLSYRLPGRALVRLDVFDSRGRRVRSLFKAEQDAGDHWLAWDGRDDLAHRVGNGQYFGRLTATGRGFSEQLTRKIVLVR